MTTTKLGITTLLQSLGTLSWGSKYYKTKIFYLDVELGIIDVVETWMAKIEEAIREDLIMFTDSSKQEVQAGRTSGA